MLKIVDCIIDLDQNDTAFLLKGETISILTIPPGATILPTITLDGKTHIRYSIDDGEPCNATLSIGNR